MGTQDSVGLSFTIWKGGIWTWWWQVSFRAVCRLLLDGLQLHHVARQRARPATESARQLMLRGRGWEEGERGSGLFPLVLPSWGRDPPGGAPGPHGVGLLSLARLIQGGVGSGCWAQVWHQLLLGCWAGPGAHQRKLWNFYFLKNTILLWVE